MKLVSLNCPNCGANFRMEVNTNRKTCFCGACGTQIILDEEIKKSEHKTIIENVADVKKEELKSIKFKQEMKDYERAIEEYYSRTKIRRTLNTVIISVWIGIFIFGFIYGQVTYDSDAASMIFLTNFGLGAWIVFGLLMFINNKPKPPDVY